MENKCQRGGRQVFWRPSCATWFNFRAERDRRIGGTVVSLFLAGFRQFAYILQKYRFLRL